MAYSTNGKFALETNKLSIYYGKFRAVKDVTFQIHPQKITALIGPSGCGKSTVLRAFNRMNDLIPVARAEGEVLFHGKNLYAPDVDAVEVRRRIGMVFQKANPFPKSIRENILYGPKINGWKGSKEDEENLVEACLRSAAVGRCEGQAQSEWLGAFGWAAAAAVHCACAGYAARSDPDG